MTINSMRTTLDAWCAKRNDCESNPCTHCPVGNIENVCSSYNWANAPEDLIEKAYLLAFGEVKEGNQMNITADEIRKAAIEMIEKMTMTQHVTVGANAAEMMRLNEIKTQTMLGYINGVCELAKRVTEGKENDQKRNA